MLIFITVFCVENDSMVASETFHLPFVPMTIKRTSTQARAVQQKEKLKTCLHMIYAIGYKLSVTNMAMDGQFQIIFDTFSSYKQYAFSNNFLQKIKQSIIIIMIIIISSSSNRGQVVLGFFRLHECWFVHLFLGRPTFFLPTKIYSYVYWTVHHCDS